MMRKQHTINIMASQIDSTNGIGNIAYHLVCELSEFYNVRVFTNEVNENLSKIDGIEVVSLGKTNVVLRNIRCLFNYIRMSKKTDVTICMSWRLGLIPYLCKFMRKTPYIILSHGNEVLPPDIGKSNRFELYLRKSVFKKSEFVCANSKYTLDLTNKICKLNDCCVIHPGCGEDIHNSKTDGHYVLSIGRIEERKGFQYVIKAFTKLKNEFPDYKYFIAGDGNYREILNNLIESEYNQDCCILLGRVSDSKKKELLQECTVLVMPSFMKESEKSVEGFGIVFLEANAYGKPVIGTDSGGIPDAIIDGKTGLIVKQKNEEAIYEAIKKIITKKVNINAKSCLNWALEHNYKIIVKQYLHVINRILSEKD